MKAVASFMLASLVHVLALPPVSRAALSAASSRAAIARPPLVSGQINQISRRNLLRGAVWASGVCYGSGTVSCASAWTVDQVKPDEKAIYGEAQSGSPGALRVLWVGAGTLKGVYGNLFHAGNEVIALDLVRPDAGDLSAATAYATEQGVRLRFEQGDATHLKFGERRNVRCQKHHRPSAVAARAAAAPAAALAPAYD